MKSTLLLLISMLLMAKGYAQLSIDGQLRTRSELLNGQSAPLPKGSKPAFFTSQRTRLKVDYISSRIQFRATLQDVRVWGQDASTNNRVSPSTSNGLMMHEAWASVGFLDTTQTKKGLDLRLKIGRQELIYDDSRLLGNLDWLQQGRRHDAAVLQYTQPGLQLHLGAAYNQNRENRSGSLYDGIPVGYAAGTNGIGTMYKSMQFIYVNRKLPRGYLSFLALKDDFQKYELTSTTDKIWKEGTWSRITFGPYLQTHLTNTWQLNASANLQTGRDKTGKELLAYFYSLKATAALSKYFNIGPGFDYSSGSTAGNSRNHSFDPLYGTPHKFWGHMDYFYTASSFGNGGLSDLYIHSSLKTGKKWGLTADIHRFNSAAVVMNETEQRPSHLGTELDFTAQFDLAKNIGIQAGYATFFSSSTLAELKGISNPKKRSDWAYIMININPSFL
ncbi:alginate export family protein [Dyadobacter tibetensis]|uniref:alginate export family protein n=1 Tax=Dyadobacter tibetensis TaxID=1211851 RepID=UPI00046F122A|nr:alginate export family protein [Dyadobacter tibetensis]